MNEEIWKIPYNLVKNDWDLLQRYLEFKGNPRYIIVGEVDLVLRQDISDLGNLVGVEGDLNLNWSSIETISELEFIGGSFGLYSCENIKTLGKIKRVDGNLYLEESSIESLGDLEFVGWNLDLSYCKNIKTLGNVKRIDGECILNDSSIVSLGELEFVGEDFFIKNTNIPLSEINNVEVVGMIYR